MEKTLFCNNYLELEYFFRKCTIKIPENMKEKYGFDFIYFV